MSGPQTLLIPAHAAIVGDGMPIHRALPSKLRRMVGPWCFLDHIGPAEITGGPGLRVGPHPHIGLQTVTWLLQGEILHRDSLGTVQPIRPGQLNVMTSGRAISHSEESPENASADIHGVQFWVALPDSERHREPMFDHYPELPVTRFEGLNVTVVMGEALGQRSPARSFSPIVGLDIESPNNSLVRMPLREDFEYAVMVIDGEARIAGETVQTDELLFLGSGRKDVQLRTVAETRLFVIGGAPFGEEILMWWNFVGRTKDDISQACTDWNTNTGAFGEVVGYDGARLVAPLPPWMTAAG